VFDRDPDDAEASLMMCAKMNIAKPAPSLRFAIPEEGEMGGVLVWSRDDVAYSADDVMGTPDDGRRAGPSVQEAGDWLVGFLEEHGPTHSTAIIDAAKKAGHAERTLKRAKAHRGVLTEPWGVPGQGGRWYWRLPHQPGKDPETGEIVNVEAAEIPF
jgi:hypothetical protein